MQADKLVFVASQAAVENGIQDDLFEQDVAALCEAEMEEEEQDTVVEVLDNDDDNEEHCP